MITVEKIKQMLERVDGAETPENSALLEAKFGAMDSVETDILGRIIAAKFLRMFLADVGDAPLEVDAVFTDWQNKKGESTYYTQAGVKLGVGVFHHGSTFPASIQLDDDDRAHLETAMKAGYTPVFAFYKKEN